MTKFRTILLAVIALIGVGATLVVHYQAQAKLRENHAALQQHAEQRILLSSENSRLHQLLAHSKRRPPVDEASTELAKLLRDAERLRKQTNELGRLRREEHGWPIWQSDVANGPSF